MKSATVIACTIALAAGLVSCNKAQNDPQKASTAGFFQELGDKATQAAQKASDAASDAANDFTKSADKAWKETERKAGNITSHKKDKLEDAANK